MDKSKRLYRVQFDRSFSVRTWCRPSEVREHAQRLAAHYSAHEGLTIPLQVIEIKPDPD